MTRQLLTELQVSEQNNSTDLRRLTSPRETQNAGSFRFHARRLTKNIAHPSHILCGPLSDAAQARRRHFTT